MDKSDIVWRLACLASLPYQERYVIGGTVDEYATSSDLLADVEALRDLIHRPEHARVTNAEQLGLLDDLIAYIDAQAHEELGSIPQEKLVAFYEGRASEAIRSRLRVVLGSH